MKTRAHVIAAVASAMLSVAGAASAGTVTYGFNNISGNSATNAMTGEAQLRVAVSMLAGNMVGFQFYHDGMVAMSIAQIYFDDNTPRLGAAGAPVGSAGVDFSAGGAPPNLPAGNEANPVFTSTNRFTANSPVASKGVNPGETLDLSFAILGSFQDVIDDITSGELRIGIHVQAFAGNGSESFVNEPICIDPLIAVTVPLPSAAGLGLVGLGVLGAGRRRRN